MEFLTRPAAWMLVLLVLLTGCRTLRLDRPDIQSETDWRTEGAGPDRRNAVDADVAPPLEQAWRYNAAAAFGPGSVLLLRDVVLVATRKGEVHAIDLETGGKLGLERMGDVVEGTPAVRGARLFVPIAEGRRSLVAWDLDRGRRAWRYDGPPVAAGVLLLGERVVTVDDHAVVRALDDEGRTVWETPLGETVHVHTSPVEVDGDVVVADDAGTVVRLDGATGDRRWTASAGAPVYVTPAADGERLYASTTRGRLAALDARTGAPAWHYAASDTTVRLTSPAVMGGELVVGASDGTIRALAAADGAPRWTTTLGEAVRAAPLVTPNHVFVGAMDKWLYVLDRHDGSVLQSLELDGRIKSAFAARDGSLIVLAEPRYVYRFVPASDAVAAREGGDR